MLASSALNESISALRITDTVAAARDFMQNQGVAELPVLDKTSLYNYARAIMLSGLDGDKKLSEVIAYNPHSPRVFMHQHLYEVVPVFSTSDLGVLAVMNETGEFAGIIDLKSIHKAITQSLTYRGIGAIMLLSVNPRDYVPSQITRLVEENGARVLGMMVTEESSDRFVVSLKINTTTVKHIVATFNRFDYKVIGCFMAEDFEKTTEKEFDSVLRFFDL